MFTFIQSLLPPFMKVPSTLGLCHFPAYPGSLPMSVHRALPRSFLQWHRLHCVDGPMNIQLLHHASTLRCSQYFAITANSGMNNLVREYFQTYEVDLKDYHTGSGEKQTKFPLIRVVSICIPTHNSGKPWFPYSLANRCGVDLFNFCQSDR